MFDVTIRNAVNRRRPNPEPKPGVAKIYSSRDAVVLGLSWHTNDGGSQQRRVVELSPATAMALSSALREHAAIQDPILLPKPRRVGFFRRLRFLFVGGTHA